jgi:AcrR family transcriptional regulator
MARPIVKPLYCSGKKPSLQLKNMSTRHPNPRMSSFARPYQGESAENRVSARRRRLLDAGFELMATEGWRFVTIDGLCRRAKLNKRYFYESFAGLDAVADAVVDDLSANLLTIGLEAAHAARKSNMMTDDLAHFVMRAVISWLVGDPRRARVLFSEISDNPRAQSHRKTVIRQMAQELSAFGHEFHGAKEPHPIAQAAAALLIGGSIEALLSWLDGDIKMSLDEFIDDIAGFWVAVGSAAVDTATIRLVKASSGKKSKVKAGPKRKHAR